MRIGNVETDNNIFLAPMAGITDLPFRLICKEKGAGLVYTEMVSARALLYGDEKTKLLLKTCKEERPLAVQIFGSDIESIAYASKYVSEFADIVDINMGCPAPKVVKNGDGSRLLLNLELVKQIVETAVKISTVRMGRRAYCCTRSCKDYRTGGSKCNYSAWKNKKSILLRRSRLGNNQKSKRDCKNSCDRKRRSKMCRRCVKSIEV